MAALLSGAWIAECNAALSGLEVAAAPGARWPLVVTEVVTIPGGADRELTLVADDEGVALVEGDDDRACAWITLSLDDAVAMHEDRLDPARALGDGRVKVRGDLRALVEAVSLLARAHGRLAGR